MVAMFPRKARRDRGRERERSLTCRLGAQEAAQGQCQDKPQAWAGEELGSDPSAHILVVAFFPNCNQTGTSLFVDLDVLFAGGLPEAGTAHYASLHTHIEHQQYTRHWSGHWGLPVQGLVAGNKNTHWQTTL